MNNQHEKKTRTFLTLLVTFLLLFFSTLFRGKAIIGIIIIEFFLIILFRVYKNIDFKIIIVFLYITIVYLFTLNTSYNSNMTTYFYGTLIFFILNYVYMHDYLEKVDNKHVVIAIRFISYIGNAIILYSLFEAVLTYNPLFYRFFPEPYYTSYSMKANYSYRINGSVGHPVPYANFTTFIMFTNWILYKIFNKKKYLFFVLLSCVSLILTFTRNNYVALILSIIIITVSNINFKRLLFKKRSILNRYFYLIIAIIILLILIFSENTLFFKILERFSGISNDLSYLQRKLGIEYVLNSLFKNPFRLLFGYGIGNLSIIREQYNIIFDIQNFYALDNQFFTFLYEFGLIGMAVILFFMSKLVKRIVKSNNNPFFSIFSSLLITLLISEFFYDGIYYWIITNFLLSTALAFFNYFYSSPALNDKIRN